MLRLLRKLRWKIRRLMNWIRSTIRLFILPKIPYMYRLRLIGGLLASSDMSVQFRSVLRNYLCFLKPSEDTNKSRWELADYWSNFLDNVLPSSCWECPGTEYNLKNLVNAVYGYRNVIGCYLRVFGWDGLKDFLRRYEPNILPLKYRIMLDNLYRPIEPDTIDDGTPLSD